MRRHDQLRAEELLSEGLRHLKISLEEVMALRQCDARKQALAWLVKSQTVVGDDWIVPRLKMGHRSNVSRAIKAFGETASPRHRKLRRLLHICTD